MLMISGIESDLKNRELDPFTQFNSCATLLPWHTGYYITHFI
jgi:hypothetical protein